MTDNSEPDLPGIGDLPPDEVSEPDLADTPGAQSAEPAAEEAGVIPPPPSPPAAESATGGAAGAADPGWYPAPGGQRYWDGQEWTEHAVAAGGAATSGAPAENSTAMWTHLSALLINFLACGLLGWIGPLVIMNGQGQESAYVRHHAVEALNFAITLAIAFVVSIVLMIVVIGFILLPIIGIGGLILQIMAAMAANRGEWYRYPISIRFVS